MRRFTAIGFTLLVAVVVGWGDAHQPSSEPTGITETSLQRAQAFLREGQLEPALAELSAGIRSDPSARLHYARALVLMDLDRLPEASRDLETAFELADDWILNRSAERLHEMLWPMMISSFWRARRCCSSPPTSGHVLIRHLGSGES